MSWSILLLPLLGGYYFLSKSIKWKHFYKRIDRQRLIFDSLLVSFIYFSASFIIWRAAMFLWDTEVNEVLTTNSLDIPYLLPSILAFLIAITHTTIFNYVKKSEENWFLSEMIRKTGNALQIDFLESYLFGEIVMITLKNGKVYVGLIAELREPHPESSFIRIILFYSGYRTETFDVCLIKDYNLNLYSLREKKEAALVTVVVAESEILSMTFYKQHIYDSMNEDQTSS